VHLYYGPNPERWPEVHLRLAYDPSALSFFSRRELPDENAASFQMWDDRAWPVFFTTSDGGPDLIASAFFWLSGWQEWAQTSRDQIGRFQFSDSLQSRFGLVEPIVDVYREVLADQLKQAGLTIRRRHWGGRRWAFCPTFDIDYTRKWRPGMVFRETIEYLLLNRRDVSVRKRLLRFGSFAKDALSPGDPYRRSMHYLVDQVRRVGGRSTVFLKAGAHGPYDVAYPLRRGAVPALLNAAGGSVEWALHPSFYAHAHPGYLAEESARLERAVGERPAAVRQHYLRYDRPGTTRIHERERFWIDSTLGFHEHEGFRNGTCLPFRIFDIPANRATTVWEMPLVIMDGALFNRRGLSAADAADASDAILGYCRRFGGAAVCLWHNVVLDRMDAPGWHLHFEHCLEHAVAGEAYVDSISGALEAYGALPNGSDGFASSTDR
jgi:hypothetical protein